MRCLRLGYYTKWQWIEFAASKRYVQTHIYNMKTILTAKCLSLGVFSWSSNCESTKMLSIVSYLFQTYHSSHDLCRVLRKRRQRCMSRYFKIVYFDSVIISITTRNVWKTNQVIRVALFRHQAKKMENPRWSVLWGKKFKLQSTS